MDKFKYKGKAEIRHLNVRKEGPEDDKVLAIDIKFQCVTSADMLDFFHEGIKDVLFTDAGAVKNLMLKPLGFCNTIMNCDLNILGQRYGGIEVGKFQLEPKDSNQVTMQFSISLQPSGDEVAKISEFVMDEIDIAVEPQPELDFGGAQEPQDGVDGAGNVTAQFGGEDSDGLYGDAVKVVLSQKRASVSLVQRHLRIGYNRAARLLEEMERQGVISADKGDGRREILKAA